MNLLINSNTELPQYIDLELEYHEAKSITAEGKVLEKVVKSISNLYLKWTRKKEKTQRTHQSDFPSSKSIFS